MTSPKPKRSSAPHHRRLLAGGLAIVLAATAGACGRSSGSAGGGGKSTNGVLSAAPGFDPATKTITLGVLTPTSTTAKLISDPLTAGNKVFFDALNAKGGIDGKYKVKLIVKDNKYGSGDNTATATAYSQIKGARRRVPAGARHRPGEQHPVGPRRRQHHRQPGNPRLGVVREAEPDAHPRARTRCRPPMRSGTTRTRWTARARRSAP